MLTVLPGIEVLTPSFFSWHIMLDLPPEGSMRVKTPSCCYCEADFSDGAWPLTHFGEPIALEPDGLL